ncbi:carbohydrate ABC transporter permease [Candidatus Hecatella orcuttiae]|jgi:ABC-type glycerol-3-phosphate transport system permease component|uniref:carbohydrate ABC transporter permease n=1 Tax=Candidatus Hecatella orcuttiae TaxID=1935119 RepID=UPI002867CE7F|nr:carbohydrate ABC transporter permease [Candidatus Hecatella orcuttiae]
MNVQIPKPNKARKIAGKIGIYTAFAILVFTILFPYFWMVTSSLQREIDLYRPPPFPFKPVKFTVFHYGELLSYPPFTEGLVNSALVALITAGFVMTAGSLGAYALVRTRFKVNRVLLQAIVIFYMLPGVALLIPVATVERALGLIDTLPGVVFAHSVFILPLMTWMLASIFRGVHMDLEEAGQVDGLSRFGTMFRVVLPLSITGVMIVTVFCFIISWNELMYSSVIGVRDFKMLQPVILEFMGPMKQVIPRVMAAGVFSSLPVIALAVILQKYIIKGIMSGAIK